MTGIDILEVERIGKAIKNKRFLDRTFTKSEQEYINTHGNPAETATGLFCAKEAVIKAIGEGYLIDYEIMHKYDGKPYITGREDLEISISHCKTYAVAICIKK